MKPPVARADQLAVLEYSASLGGGLIEASRRRSDAGPGARYSASLGGGLIEAVSASTTNRTDHGVFRLFGRRPH